MTAFLDHSWTFAAANCANARIAQCVEENDFERAQREWQTAFNLRIAAARSFALVNPKPSEPKPSEIALPGVYEAYEQQLEDYSIAWNRYFEAHLGLCEIGISSPEGSELYANWWHMLYPFDLEVPHLDPL